ncbi:NCAIR mutase (PurE)-related protein [Archaeoglobus sulfaticallidus PM70-1]|uniref:NCAIR mutase (PurE)-related protein n=1 Tax=Archaeoglobus sulfaticallidus PM70-1 TaxID=387631 RepID=N0BDZ2_9EURY|nr:nickel pincer cofactor biosynthesis protein LarB [Archaeoglobus sulfaticallidus]AGK60442.1 NCAIR mutase (PurE)-related protein [Archaeoglobus sulfaticallidus PM70-1]
MDIKEFRRILEIAKGKPDFMDELNRFFYEQIEDFAKLDHLRIERAGKPEAIYAEGKSPEEVVKIIKNALKHLKGVLVTRASKEQIEEIKKEFRDRKLDISERSGTVIVGEKREVIGKVAIISAGTSDIPVAEEAVKTCEFLGLEVKKYYDAGVAGIHRLIKPIKEINSDSVDSVIVVAGMEGALPSVVAGLVDVPVIAVPTSIGYGVSLGGLTALFSMLQSCSSGVAVVNIDNGFGAGVFAYLISRTIRKRLKS